MVPSGNITGPNIENYFSSVISLISVRTVAFLAELYNIETRTGGIINAYLNAHNRENIVFNTGP